MDQHFPGPVTEGVRERRIDVLTAQDAGVGLASGIAARLFLQDAVRNSG